MILVLLIILTKVFRCCLLVYIYLSYSQFDKIV